MKIFLCLSSLLATTTASKFSLSSSSSSLSTCNASTFPVSMNNTQCWNLNRVETATTPADCLQACCAEGTTACITWQFCPSSGACVDAGNPADSCWIGNDLSTCKPISGWIGATTNPPPSGSPFAINISSVPAPPTPLPPQGTAVNPNGDTIKVNSQSFTFNEAPWLLTMGEMQYARQPDVQRWKDELMGMKAGGLQAVGTYVFWIHHEEINGTWIWDDTSARSLRLFVTTAQEVGLKVFVRMGPWSHGECRNGGFPDWLEKSGIPLRSQDPRFLDAVSVLYSQIAQQLQGLYFKDGGPVIGVQIDNEWSGSYTYLEALKNISIAAGIDTPFYSKTGWPPEPQPYGDLIPFFGGYAAGFWGGTYSGESSYYVNFLFNTFGQSGYPLLSVELGGGMTTSYHRRIHVYPNDMGASALVTLGSGSNCLGYYIYKGATQPIGQLSTLQESQLSGYPNDLPMRNYDFNAPISEFGHYHGHYHLLRRLHLFVENYNAWLAALPSYFPDGKPTGVNDTSTLRWSVRSNGTTGAIFVNQYQRYTAMQDVPNVRLNITLAGGGSSSLLQVPSPTSVAPTIPAGSYFVWPFNFLLWGGGTVAASSSSSSSSMPLFTSAAADMTGGIALQYALAMPLVTVMGTGAESGASYIIFGATDGITPELAIYTSTSGGGTVSIVSCPNGASCTTEGGLLMVRNITPSTSAAVVLQSSNVPASQTTTIVVLDYATSLQLYQGTLAGQTRAFLSLDGAVLLDPSTSSTDFKVRSEAIGEFSFAVFPPLSSVSFNGSSSPLVGTSDGIFTRYSVPAPEPQISVSFAQVQEAGPPRTVPIGPAGVAEAPDGDGSTNAYAAAAIFNVTLTLENAPGPQFLPRVVFNYTGDCARVYYNGTILSDNFYNSDIYAWGIARYGSEFFPASSSSVTVQLYVLPLSQDSPIYIYDWPLFPGNASSVVSLNSVEIVQQYDYAFQVVA